MSIVPKRYSLKWWVCIALPKLPVFILALPFAVLMKLFHIRMIAISERIGHGIGNIDVYLLERRAETNPVKAIDIFYPDRPWRVNKQLLKMWKRVIPVYDIAYWIAWANWGTPFFKSLYYHHPQFDRDIHALSNDAPPPFAFTRQEEDRGAVMLREMGIPAGSQIVCFHTRDNVFLKSFKPQNDFGYHSYRDTDINTYEPAIKELVARGYYCIRMGRMVSQEFTWKHAQVIDYATSAWQSDFADMFLLSQCNFYIGSNCGLDAIAAVFRKSMSVPNRIPMRGTWGWSRHNLDIHKKLWLTSEKRFLTFKEILGSEISRYMHTELFTKAGIEIINNTPEEIRDVVIEKEERMRGVWQTNEEYEELQQRFWALYTPDEYNQVLKARVGSKFLQQNKNLLD